VGTLVYCRAGVVDYRTAWDWQRKLHARRVAGDIDDVCLLLEHPAVYTAGKRTEAHERPADGTPVIDVDRGGKITWHGPGQLVGYPIVAIPGTPYDVVAHVRRLEEALIRACAEAGLATTRVEGRSGVWVPTDGRGPARKIAAIGVRVARGVSMHGFALNCDAGLAAFDAIVPCGITDAGVTSLTRELDRTVGVDDVIDTVEQQLAGVLGTQARTATPPELGLTVEPGPAMAGAVS
jgi:lipoyl(octanoyl) transferase